MTNIKRLRNDLAHGNSIFSDCGREISIVDYEGYLKEVEEYLRDFEYAINEYIKNELYRSGTDSN